MADFFKKIIYKTMDRKKVVMTQRYGVWHKEDEVETHPDTAKRLVNELGVAKFAKGGKKDKQVEKKSTKEVKRAPSNKSL